MVPKYLLRFAELYERQGLRVEIMDDNLWVNYGRMIIPIGPIHKDYSISEEQAHRLMKKIPGSLMVRYTYCYQERNNCEDWYAVICDNFEDLGSFPHKYRWQIKSGLKNCTIRQVDAGFIAEYGYEVYASAFSRYQGLIKPIGEIDFTKMIDTTRDFDDIYHYWAVFYGNKLIGYSMVAIYGDEAADISVGKFIPEYLKLHPCNALFYVMNKHYLQDNSMPYLNNGFRNIYHKTNVHEFFIKKLSFKKVYLNLGIIYNQPFLYFLKLTYPFRGMLSKASPKLEAIYMLEEIRRKCASGVDG
jgi:hypothetical protein